MDNCNISNEKTVSVSLANNTQTKFIKRCAINAAAAGHEYSFCLFSSPSTFYATMCEFECGSYFGPSQEQEATWVITSVHQDNTSLMQLIMSHVIISQQCVCVTAKYSIPVLVHCLPLNIFNCFWWQGERKRGRAPRHCSLPVAPNVQLAYAHCAYLLLYCITLLITLYITTAFAKRSLLNIFISLALSDNLQGISRAKKLVCGYSYINGNLCQV